MSKLRLSILEGKMCYFVLPFLLLSTLFISSIHPDTLTVTSLADSGPGSLRTAIMGATDGDTIVFDNSLFGTITLASSLPDIVANYLTIAGPVNQAITIDGSSSYRIFNIQSTPVIISHLNLNNGADPGQGGAVHVNEENHTYLSNIAITAAGTPNGENSLFAEANGILDLTDVTFLSPSAPQIYLNSGSLNITSNIPLAFVIDGIGEAQVYKYGNAMTSISTPITPSLVLSDFYLIVVDGLVSFDGYISNACVIFSNGTLCAFTNLVEIANQGIFSAGGPLVFCNLLLSKNYINSKGDTQIKINPSGSVDTIHTTGDIFLDGHELTILPFSGTYLAGTTYTFLSTTGGVQGEFNSVSTGGLNIQINYLEQSVQIEILTTTTL